MSEETHFNLTSHIFRVTPNQPTSHKEKETHIILTINIK